MAVNDPEYRVPVRILAKDSGVREGSGESTGPQKSPETPQERFVPPRKGAFRWALVIIAILLALSLTGIGIIFMKGSTTLRIVSGETKTFRGIDVSSLPEANPREENRLDILILGIRGEKDPHGGLLTDALLLVSLKTDTGDAAFISIPRDIYLEIPLVKTKAKINEAYAIGEQHQYGGGGLILAKLAAQEITGVNIDYAVSVDFEAFREVIDVLGGIEVNVAKPFRENLQWGGIDFAIPAGRQHMDTETALLYIRSRFTTSDFDRSRRQQEVLLAIKEKALTEGFLKDPRKIFALLDTVGKHVRTDMSIKEILALLPLAGRFQNAEVEHIVLDTRSGFLSSSVSLQGSYILKPTAGTFKEIRAFIQHIFDESVGSR